MHTGGSLILDLQALVRMGINREGLLGDAAALLCSARDCCHAVEAIWQHGQPDLDETDEPFDSSWM